MVARAPTQLSAATPANQTLESPTPTPGPERSRLWRVVTALPRLISFLLFSWVSSLVVLGFKRTLVFGDLHGLPRSETSKKVYEQFMVYLEEAKNPVDGTPRVGRALWKLVRVPCITGFALLALSEAANLASPIFVGAIM